MVNTIDFIAVSSTRYRQFQECTANELHELHQIIKGWPDSRREVPHSVREYWNIRDELGVADGIIRRRSLTRDLGLPVLYLTQSQMD